MEETTESVPKLLQEDSCYEKATAKGEPTFTLRAQDITADLFVEAWGYAQLFIESRMKGGMSLADALVILRDRMRMVMGSDFVTADIIAEFPKCSEAFTKAQVMREWPVRRMPD